MSSSANRAGRAFLPVCFKLSLCVAALMGAGLIADAQSIIAPGPGSPVEGTLVNEQPGVRRIEQTTLAPVTPTPPALEPLYQWGGFQIRPHFDYRLVYAEGVQHRAGEALNTALQEIAPGSLFQLGDHWLLDYTPRLKLYSNAAFRDSLDHSVRLVGNTVYQDWTLGFAQIYNALSETLVQTAQQTDQEIHMTRLDARYQFSSKASLELGLNQTIRLVPAFVDSYEWSNMDWLNYQFLPRADAAIGVGGGYVHLAEGSDMIYEMFQGRLGWHPTSRLALQVQGGLEDRQFEGDAPDRLSPILSASVIFRPFEFTTLSLSANRAVTPSYYSNQILEITEFSGTVRQRFLGHFYLDLSGGHSTTKYEASARQLRVARQDDYNFFSVRLSTVLLKRASVGLFYQLSDNSSAQEGFSFSSTQFGLEVGYRW